jgi:poly(ADP-ribose) glycohydrolase ARH3
MESRRRRLGGLEIFKGSMVGCAVGDALGSSFEGSSEPEYKNQFSGKWTDDTHMMIGVAESLIENKGFDGGAMAQTFIKHYEEEPWRGYASGPPQIFKWIKSGTRWDEASRKLFGGEGSLGNGAAMRVAPVGLMYFDDLAQLRIVAYGSAQITHAHELGKEGASIEARAVAQAVLLARSPPSTDFDPHGFLVYLKNLARSEVFIKKLEKVEQLLGNAPKGVVVREIGNGVEAYNSVPAAIYSFLLNTNSYEAAVRYAVSLGGDTDTIGAMTGAISGAYLGLKAIPQEWKSKLERKDYIERLAEKLWRIKERELRGSMHQR